MGVYFPKTVSRNWVQRGVRFIEVSTVQRVGIRAKQLCHFVLPALSLRIPSIQQVRLVMQANKATLLFVIMALLVTSAFGQTVSSSLVGTVLDPANAVVPNAPVKLTDQNTGTVREANTDSAGVFR